MPKRLIILATFKVLPTTIVYLLRFQVQIICRCVKVLIIIIATLQKVPRNWKCALLISVQSSIYINKIESLYVLLSATRTAEPILVDFLKLTKIFVEGSYEMKN